jgi:sugar/nucleoside kinase (ribokinase family)
LLQAADYVIFSEYGPVQLAAEIGAPASAAEDPLRAAQHIMAERMPHVQVAIVTRGAQGSVAFERVASEGCAAEPALARSAGPLPVETRQERGWAVHTCGVWPIERVVDTTGAGDAFIGAALFALSHQLPIEKVLPFASCVAALNCTGEGPRGGMPTWAEMPRCFDEWFKF